MSLQYALSGPAQSHQMSNYAHLIQRNTTALPLKHHYMSSSPRKNSVLSAAWFSFLAFPVRSVCFIIPEMRSCVKTYCIKSSCNQYLNMPGAKNLDQQCLKNLNTQAISSHFKPAATSYPMHLQTTLVALAANVAETCIVRSILVMCSKSWETDHATQTAAVAAQSTSYVFSRATSCIKESWSKRLFSRASSKHGASSSVATGAVSPCHKHSQPIQLHEENQEKLLPEPTG